MATTTNLAEIVLDDLPAGFGEGIKPIGIPATRFRQGGRTQYHFTIPVIQMTRLLQRPDPSRSLPGNRRVDPLRAKKFADYLVRNADWVSPAIIVRIGTMDVGFKSLVDLPDGTAWGELQIPAAVVNEIILLDGQHRTLGVFEALELLNEEISRLKMHISQMEEQEMPVSSIFQQKALLDEALGKRTRLTEEHVSIDLVECNELQASQMFGDINNNSKGVNADFITLLDQRNIINRIAVHLIHNHPLLRERVELGRSTRMSSANENLIGAKGVADISRSVLVGSSNIGAKLNKDMSAHFQIQVHRVEAFFDLLSVSFADFRDMMDEENIEVTPKSLRERSLLGSMTFLRALAMVFYELLHPSDRTLLPFTPEDVGAFFEKLDPHLGRIPIDPGDTLWMSTQAFMAGGTAPLARQGNVRSLVDAMVLWARTGIPDATNHTPSAAGEPKKTRTSKKEPPAYVPPEGSITPIDAPGMD